MMIENLIVEVTRKCNLRCQHCLRGNPQRKNLNPYFLAKLLRLVDDVCTLTITGGEPFLNTDGLYEIRNTIVQSDCRIGSWFMVTNGTSPKMKDMLDWARLMFAACYDNDISAITFSTDYYHELSNNQLRIRERNRDLYKMHFEDKSYDHTKGYIHHILPEGRAKESKPFLSDNGKSLIDNNTIRDIYLTIDGKLIADCNYSFERMDKRDSDIFIGAMSEIHCTEDLIKAVKEFDNRHGNG